MKIKDRPPRSPRKSPAEGTRICFKDLETGADEYKRMRRELRELKERFRALSEASFGGIAIHDRGIILDCNKGLSDITGFSRDELVGMDGLMLVAPAWRDHVMQNIVSGYDKAYDVEGLRKDGSFYPLEIRGKNIPYHGRTVRVTEFRDITGRRQLEENLHLNEERLRMAQQAGNIGMFDLNMSTGEIAFNDEMKRMLGLPPGYGGKIGNWLEYTPREDIDAYLLRMEKTLRERGREVAGEYRIIRPEGGFRWVSSRSAIHYDDSGNPVRMVGSVVDITDLKRAQEILSSANTELEENVKARTGELTESNKMLFEQSELLQKVIDNIPVMINLLDAEGRTRLINAEMERKSGWSREDLKHVDPIEKGYPDPEKRKAVMRYIKESKGGWQDFEPVTKTGEILPSSWAVVRLSDGSVIGIGIDIGERIKMEKELVRLGAAIEQAGEGIMLFNAEGIIEYVNPAFERLSGYSREEIIGRTAYALGEDTYKSYSRIFAQMRVDRKTWSDRETRIRKNGDRLDVYMTVSPVTDPQGRITNFVSVLRDITQEVRFQQHVFQSHKLEAIGALAGGIAHDLKNILTPVLINTEMAMEDLGDDHPLRPVLSEVLDAAKMGKDLVSQILTFSRRTPQQKIPVDVLKITRETLAFLRSSLPSDIEIRQHLDEEVCARSLADPTQIKQVLINLGSNAGYAMKQHGGLLDVTLSGIDLVEESTKGLSPDLAPGSYILISMQDTGEGMDEQTLEHIFEPFFTTKPKGEGTGMGLAVAHGIVQNHQGAITARSTPGVGTTFTVYLPMAKNECSKAGTGKPAA